MDADEFRKRGKEMVEYIASYMENITDRRVSPNIEPGYLRPLLPTNAPNTPEKWENVMYDVENKIMPGRPKAYSRRVPASLSAAEASANYRENNSW